MRLLRLALDLLLWPAVALTAALSAGAALMAQLGRVSLKWDVLAQFAPFWLLASACVLVACALFRGWRRWVVASAGLVGLAAAVSLVVPEYLRSTGPHAPADAPDRLKIIQFNVWHENPDPQPILAWLDAERPDLVVIEENSPRFWRAVAAHGGWSVACPHCEVMILSRTPALSVASTHWRRKAPPTPLTHAVFRDRRGLFDVVGVHEAWPTDPDQPYQERRLAAVIAAAPMDRLIVTGDFNSAPWSFARRRWDSVFGIPRRERALPSWPAQTYKRLKWLGLPFLPIDHVYAGPAWATVSVARGPRLTSDHYPVVVTLAPIDPGPVAPR
jgi:endonuclease/exonuclease/phosphatase (EEP) superfamily protein YafD